MKAFSIVAAVLAAGVIGASALAAPGGSSLPAFSGCFGIGKTVRPQSILFACGDGGFYVNHLHWSRWTSASATALGIGHQNDCIPDCARGHFHAYAGVSVRLRRPENCTRRRRLFTRVTVRFTRQKPPGEKYRRFTEKAPFVYRSGCP